MKIGVEKVELGFVAADGSFTTTKAAATYNALGHCTNRAIKFLAGPVLKTGYDFVSPTTIEYGMAGGFNEPGENTPA